MQLALIFFPATFCFAALNRLVEANFCYLVVAITEAATIRLIVISPCTGTVAHIYCFGGTRDVNQQQKTDDHSQGMFVHYCMRWLLLLRMARIATCLTSVHLYVIILSGCNRFTTIVESAQVVSVFCIWQPDAVFTVYFVVAIGLRFFVDVILHTHTE